MNKLVGHNDHFEMIVNKNHLGKKARHRPLLNNIILKTGICQWLSQYFDIK
jgi:hypothetical protein